MVFGLVYPESRKIAKEQGCVDALLAFENRNPETSEAMKKVRSVVNAFFEQDSKHDDP